MNACSRKDEDAVFPSPTVDVQDVKRTLEALGVDILEPETKKEQILAEALEAFSEFILEEEKEKCLAILDKHDGASVGELQGGSDQHDIYRVSITEEDDDAVAELLRLFRGSSPRYANVLTIDKLRRYMLGMCDKRSNASSRNYRTLGNLMFILAFGPTFGQVRHIDHMDPNVQICLYMSNNCPTTIVYSMEGPPITNCRELVEHWETTAHLVVPELVKDILLDKGDALLKDASQTKYFSFWNTINAHFKWFGKLYQPVSQQLSLLQTDPGTTLIAGGNEVHAGPPTVGPRMFAFAIGIPDEEDNIEKEDNNGEVQYSPPLLQADLCCILFGAMDFEYADRMEEHLEAKRFLIDVLVTFVQEYPQENYVRLLGDERIEVRNWLGRLVQVLEDQEKVNALMKEAIESETMFYSPDVGKRRAKKKKKGRLKNRGLA
jgi:hypothetical protein